MGAGILLIVIQGMPVHSILPIDSPGRLRRQMTANSPRRSDLPIVRDHSDVGSLIAGSHVHEKPIFLRWQFTFDSSCSTRASFRETGFRTLGQFLHALCELLAHSVHLAVDGGVKRGEPFVVHDE